MSISHGKPAGNPAARIVQQQAARNAQMRNEQNRQRQPRPVNPEPPDDDAEADSELRPAVTNIVQPPLTPCSTILV
jgi:hypothetical protein